jgi:hypothetical protein
VLISDPPRILLRFTVPCCSAPDPCLSACFLSFPFAVNSGQISRVSLRVSVAGLERLLPSFSQRTFVLQQFCLAAWSRSLLSPFGFHAACSWFRAVRLVQIPFLLRGSWFSAAPGPCFQSWFCCRCSGPDLAQGFFPSVS